MKLFFLEPQLFPYFFVEKLLDTDFSSPFFSYEAENSATIVNFHTPLPTPGADSSL
jgi:hypothetical protein